MIPPNTADTASTPTQLRMPVSPKLDKRLLAYAAAASAAGVGLLTQSAEAKIVYTAANVSITADGPGADIDLNNDGIADFTLDWGYTGGLRHPEGNFSSALVVSPAQAANEVWGIVSAKGWDCAAALPAGIKVGAGAAFQQGYLDLHEAAGSYTRGGTEHCPWTAFHRGAFLGLKFVVNGQTHYGWAHVTVGQTTVLNGYAYETVPNQPILTGKTSGPASITQSRFTPVSDSQPASLSLLAQGESGLQAWRREEDQPS